MLSIDLVRYTVKDIQYKALNFLVTEADADGCFIQLAGWLSDNQTGENEYQLGRKWYMPFDKPASEIVSTVFLAVQTWEEHETREQFLYCGESIYSPHLNVGQLMEIARDSHG